MSAVVAPMLAYLEGRRPSNGSRSLADTQRNGCRGDDEAQRDDALVASIDQVSLIGAEGEAQTAAANVFDDMKLGNEDIGNGQRLHYGARVVWHGLSQCPHAPVVPETLVHDASPRTQLQLPQDGLNAHDAEASSHASVKNMSRLSMMTVANVAVWSPWKTQPEYRP